MVLKEQPSRIALASILVPDSQLGCGQDHKMI